MTFELSGKSVCDYRVSLDNHMAKIRSLTFTGNAVVKIPVLLLFENAGLQCE